ncbi:MAG: hypothetical protein ABEJ87_01470 [Candidatus Nanohalobium sp.]
MDVFGNISLRMEEMQEQQAPRPDAKTYHLSRTYLQIASVKNFSWLTN